MKRSVALVDYASSDEDSHNHDTGEDEDSTAPQPLPPKKLKKLPSLPAYLVPSAPVDNPALHQGRRRTTPHVEGQFAAYAYIPLLVEKQSALHELLLRIFTRAKEHVPSLQAIGSSSFSTEIPMELHISLTRPTYLRAHQRGDFKRAVQGAAKSRRKFAASFATLSELTNDERTRTFLTLEIGAGHEHFKALSDDLVPLLRSIRQKEFYAEPRFHASIAWALLNGSRQPTLADSLEASFPTIPSFPPSLVPQLQAEFARELVKPGVGSFEAEEIRVRIGKEISRWTLQDSVL
ncbi:hypothetical protein OH77DRAFT_1431075 [Trametes cingulata]|nr:hypothetical protein OH77DRAFT_1431075 [Trametes cingulata]